MVLVFKNFGERSTAENYRPVSLLSVVSKIFEKLNNRIVEHQKKHGLFSNFKYDFRPSGSTADLIIVVSDRIARDVTGLGLLELWQLIYPRLLTRFWMLIYFTSLSLMECQVRCLALFLLLPEIDGFEWF